MKFFKFKERISRFVNLWRNLLNFRTSRKIMQASVMLQKAIDKAEKEYKKDGHRRFVIFDPSQRCLVSITYHLYSGRGDSYVYLHRRGRFTGKVSYIQMKEMCYYYTPSRNGAERCTPQQAQTKALRWQRDYVRMKR